MRRKRLTQVFPFLLPLRLIQRKFFYYLKMWFDRNKYSRTQLNTVFPYQLFEAKSVLINPDTGFDIQYQINKVHNLKLAAQTLNKVLIKPQETFSFWQLVRHAQRHGRYKAGLALVNGKITPTKGGGLCLLSNLLFWLFLHTPLTILERHPHPTEAFPGAESDIPLGTDATINEGWLDLKMKNNTDMLFQLEVLFDEQYITVRILTSQPCPFRYEVEGANQRYIQEGNKIFRENDIYQNKLETATGKNVSRLSMYRNRCLIKYQLPDKVEIKNIGG